MKNFDLQKKADILIVDDVPENLKLLFTMLTEQGYDVRRVLSGKQALKAIEFDPPDLILLDIKMPEMDGYQVCQHLKNSPKTQDIPIIFLSALNDTFDKIKAFESGGIDFINKPFQISEVLVRVDNQIKILKMQRKLQQKTQELDSLTEELETIQAYLAGDLHQSCSNINSFSYILKENYQQKIDPKAIDLISIIDQNSEKMEIIIQELLRLSKIKSSPLVRESVNLSKLVTNIIPILKQINLERKIDFLISDNLNGKGDEKLLDQLLNNLLYNACLSTNKKEQTVIEFGSIAAINQAIYFVKDNGFGFNSEQIDLLFTPSQILPNQEELPGYGIRLLIVNQIIQRHGGKIWCESEPNQGATFYFTLE